MKKICISFAVLFALILLPHPSRADVTQGGAIAAFDIQPHAISVLPSGQQVAITFKITAYPSKLSAYCGTNDSIYWDIYERSPTNLIKEGFQSIDPAAEGRTYDVTLDNPFQLPQKGTSATRTFYALIECNTRTGKNIATSGDVTLTVQGGVGSRYACIANDGKYACSTQSGSAVSGNAANCSTAQGCTGLPCFSVDTNVCGNTATEFSYAYSAGPQTYVCSPGKKPDCSDAPNYQGQACVKIPTSYCGTAASTTVSGTGDKTYSFQITNPLKGGPNDIFDVINIATRWLLNISIPLAVLFILYAGFLMLTAGPTPAKYEQGKKILKNVVIGLAVIFIGRGFITLIYSILELGGANTTPTVQTPGTGTNTGNSGNGGSAPISPIPRGVGGLCGRNSDCNSGLVCQDNMCQHQEGNYVGEPCLHGANCYPVGYKVTQDNVQYACDNSVTNTIDGRTVGVCYDVTK